MKWLKIVLIVFLLALLAAACINLLIEELHCNERGGVFIKQTFSYKCVYIQREQ